jgi:hypothetical protein
MNNLIEEQYNLDATSIVLGKYFDGSTCVYDLGNTTNFNIALIGESGTGKTYALKKIIAEYFRLGTAPIILDVHGDFRDIPGVPDNMIKDVKFAYQGGNGAVNPLYIEPGASGGLYIAIKKFMRLVRIHNPELGSRQKSIMKQLVKGVYEEFGITINNQTSWGNRAPTLEDLRDFAIRIVTGVVVSKSPDSDKPAETPEEIEVIRNVKSVSNELFHISSRIAKVSGLIDEDSADFAEDTTIDTDEYELEKKGKASGIVEGISKLFHEYTYKLIRNLTLTKMGKSNDGIAWDAERVEGVLETINDMIDTGLFGHDALEFSRTRINRVSLTALEEDDQLLMINLILDRVFNMATKTFKKEMPKVPHIMMILDEGKLAKASSTGPLNPLDRIGTEGRGFGVGIALGVQSPDHITADVKRNCGLIAVLPINPTEQGALQRLFKIKPETMAQIKPKSDALIFIKGGTFKPIHLFR